MGAINESAIKSSEFFRNVPKYRRFKVLTCRRGPNFGIPCRHRRENGLAGARSVRDFPVRRLPPRPARRTLSVQCAGKFEPLAIGSRALDILGVLIEQAGEVVSKDEIVATVWPGTVVEESNLTVQISALRRVLDRGRLNGSCIQTVARRGYRFLPEVMPLSAEHRWADVRVAPAAPISQPVIARRLSLVVLPFTNFSGCSDRQYFVDSITDDLTTDLSGIPNALVISRGTAFTYKDKPVNAKQIGRELGVRYVLEGSVRRSGNNVQINAQLIDAENDSHLWAERFGGDIDDLFVLQNDLTSRIAIALGLELVEREAARSTKPLDALDYILRGRAVMNAPKTRETWAEAIKLFERALTIDPQAVEAQSRLAIHLSGRVMAGTTDTGTADVLRAESLAKRALTAAPRNPLAHMAQAMVLEALNRPDEAVYEFETVLKLNRNYVPAYAHLGYCKIYAGATAEAIPLFEQAIRLSPHDPDIGFWYQSIGRVHLMQACNVEAVIWLEKARSANPQGPNIRAWLAAACALDGDSERGAAELAEARRMGGNRYSSIARTRAAYMWAPEARALLETSFFAGLRKAGMPEE